MVVIQRLTGLFFVSNLTAFILWILFFFLFVLNSLRHFYSTFMISALTGDGVNELQEYLLNQVCRSTHSRVELDAKCIL